MLKRYEDDNDKPLDLVNPETAAKFGYPLSLYSYDPAMRQRLATALYVPSATGDLIAPGELTFDYASGGLVVKKTFRFDASYVIHVTASVTNNGSPLPTLIALAGGHRRSEHAGLLFQGAVRHLAERKVREDRAEESERRRDAERPIRLRRYQRPVLRRDLPAGPAGPDLGDFAEQRLEHSERSEAAEGRERSPCRCWVRRWAR